MKYRRIVAVCSILFVLALCVMIKYEYERIQLNRRIDEIISSIEQEKTDDLVLTIYSMGPGVFTYVIQDVESLQRTCNKGRSGYNKSVYKGADIEECIHVLKQVQKVVPVKRKDRIHARVYYTIESPTHGILLEVAMWGWDNHSMLINGIEIEHHDMFFDAVRPFLESIWGPLDLGDI